MRFSFLTISDLLGNTKYVRVGWPGFQMRCEGERLEHGGWGGEQGFGFSLMVLPLPLQVRRDTGERAKQHRDMQVRMCVCGGVPVCALILGANRERSPG